MRIPIWRLVLAGGALSIVAVAGMGLVAASSSPAAPAGSVATALETAAPDATGGAHEGNPGQRDAGLGARALRLGRHLVHAEVTVTDREGNLVDLQLDHGTVRSIGGGSLVIAEAGGRTETVSIDDATIVRLGREPGELGDVTAGVEVFVQSRVDGTTVLARRIIVVRAAVS